MSITCALFGTDKKDIVDTRCIREQMLIPKADAMTHDTGGKFNYNMALHIAMSHSAESLELLEG